MKDAINAYMDDRLLVGANWDVWVTKNEAVRAGMARVLRARPDEIAVTASASAGINALASACDFSGRRNKVVISDFEFPTNAQIWHAQERRGARVVHVPRTADGYIPLESFARGRSTRRPRWSPSRRCASATGRCSTSAGIAKLAARERREDHARLLPGGRGRSTVDVKKLDVDFAVGGMLKYLLGTAGLGFMYVRGDLVAGSLLPSNTGWFAPENIPSDGHHRQPPVPYRPALRGRHAGGGQLLCRRGGPEDHPGGGNGRDRGPGALSDGAVHGAPGRDRLAEHHPAAGGAARPVCVRSRGVEQLFWKLMGEDIVTSFRDDNLRATFHFYNSEQDVDSLVGALARHRAQLVAAFSCARPNFLRGGRAECPYHDAHTYRRKSRDQTMSAQAAFGRAAPAAAGFPAEALRAQSPALHRAGSFIFFDNAAGAQVPQLVLDALTHHLLDHNVQRGGRYPQTLAVDAMIARARASVAAFVNARRPEEIAFGLNATSFIRLISLAIGQTLETRNEIIITDLDHEANVATWLVLERMGAPWFVWWKMRADEAAHRGPGAAADAAHAHRGLYAHLQCARLDH